MTLAASWIVFPAILVVLALGCGLLVERLAGLRLPGALLAPLGVATIVVVGQLATASDASAELAAPAVAALAVAGLALAFPWRDRRPDGWLIAATVAVFLAYAAPVALSGQATFAGYIKLDDTATWMALTDRVMEHGRSLSGLLPSTYEATLAFNLGAGYPIGAFMPLGIGRALSGQDVAWVIQPYLAFLAAMLALSLGTIVRPIVRSRWLVAVVVFIAAQAALLYGYSLWGGIKELAAAALIALAAALLPLGIGRGRGARALIPLALATAALAGVLSAAGAIFWLAALLLAGFVAALQLGGPARAVRTAAEFLALALLFSVPLFLTGKLLPATLPPLSSTTALVNLFEPLSKLQLFGVWPVGDFRVRPADMAATWVLVLVVAASGAVGLALAWKMRAFALLLYTGTATLGCFVLVVAGSPWVEAKALATASPSFLLLALAGAAALFVNGRRIEGGIPLAAVAIGVLWSNGLAYHEVNLAPRDQLAELQGIGMRIAGQGPTLMTEYQPYGARHLLRDADPEGVSELRRRKVPKLNGRQVAKGLWADTDTLQLGGLLTYRTLVLRRSPVQSRPPSVYELVSAGRHYEVWQRPPIAPPIEHLPLGTVTDPSGVAPCAAVARLATFAGSRGTLVAAPRAATIVLPLAQTRHPAPWERPDRGSGSLFPASAGTATGSVRLGRLDRYRLWLGGSVRGRMEIFVDGRSVATARDQLNNDGLYVELGAARLGPGTHTVELVYRAPDLEPGSGASGPNVYPIGPLVLSAGSDNPGLIRVKPARARSLCGRRLDWVEAHKPLPSRTSQPNR